MRRVPFFPMLITVLISIGGYLGCQPPQEIVQQVGQQVEQRVTEEIGRVGQQIQNGGGLLPGGLVPGGLLPGGPVPGGMLPDGQIPGVPVSTGRNVPLTNTQVMPIPQRTQATILIGSFNMQRLGPSKLANPTVMQYFANIIQRFDVIALQEITSKDQTTLSQLLQYVNASGGRYSYVISEPVGRSIYLEQYAFVFDTTRITTRQDACFVMRDEEDLLHREPFVGRFATLAPNPFGFVLINMHTDPDLVNEELNTLASVYINVANFFYQGAYPEDDIVLLGDLNADPKNFRNLANVPNLLPTIVGLPTNFTRTKTNDNILVNRAATREFTGRSGVFDLQTAYNISQEQAKLISDHMPVWAEFTIQEVNNGQVASQGSVSWMR